MAEKLKQRYAESQASESLFAVVYLFALANMESFEWDQGNR